MLDKVSSPSGTKRRNRNREVERPSPPKRPRHLAAKPRGKTANESADQQLPPSRKDDQFGDSSRENKKASDKVIRGPHSSPPREKTLEEKYDDDRKRKPGETVFGEKIDRFTPMKQETILEDEEDYGKFLERVEFESEHCPDQFREFNFYDVQSDNIKWDKIEALERKTMLDGRRGKRIYKYAGWVPAKESTIFERYSAAKLYSGWRSSVIGDRKKFTGEHAKAPRSIKLIEHEPCGPTGEPGRWAANVKALKQMLQTGCRGTHFTIVVGVIGNHSAARGVYKEWYDAILTLIQEFPENFTVEIESESVMDVDPVSFYPKDDLVEKAEKHNLEECCQYEGYGNYAVQESPRKAWDTAMTKHKDTMQWKHDGLEFMEYKKAEVERMMESLRKRDRDNLENRRQAIDDNFAVCRKFVEDIRHFQEHGFLPGDTLPGKTLADGNVKPVNRFAPSVELFKSITTKKAAKAVKPPPWKGGAA